MWVTCVYILSDCDIMISEQVQEARNNHDEELVKKTVEEYDETLEWYVNVCV